VRRVTNPTAAGQPVAAGPNVSTEVSVVRQSPNRPGADEPEVELDQDRDTGPDEAGTETATAVDTDGTADRSLWEDVRIAPVEIALPAGSGFTLRAYRMSDQLTPTDVSDREVDDPFAARAAALTEDEDDEDVVILDEEFAELVAEDDDEDAGRRRRGDADDDAEATSADDDADADDEDDDAVVEEVPVFLSHRGRLLLFKSPESLVSFVKSGAPHDLAQLDTWDDLAERIRPADVAPLDEDAYELDLVVENLRGGHDVWDPALLIEAGEVARDLAYALRLTSVQDMLSAGSSLDDLDEALRATVRGGLGGFMGRRRLRKIGAQTASLGWRTIIGKISAVVDWRD
jgi:hypothetical protein